MRYDFRYCTRTQNCPYCGKNCISFILRLRAGANKYYKFPKCPECGASIRYTEKQTRIKFLLHTLPFVLFWITAFYTDGSELIIWSAVFIAAELIVELAFAAFGRIDYEGTWKYPKPSPYYNESADDATQEQEDVK